VLDYSALEPGRAASDAVMQTVRELRLDNDYQARVRLTGLVPMNDDQFATIRESAPLTAAVSLVSVFVILWLALRYKRIILAVAVNLAAGGAIQYKYYRKNADGSVTWECYPESDNCGGNRSLAVPSSGPLPVNDTVSWN